MNDFLSNCIDAWVVNRKKPLQLNMKDPIVFSYYEGQEVSVDDPRIGKFSFGEQVGKRLTLYIWLN